MGKVFSRRNMKYLAQMILNLSDKDDKLDPYTLRRISEIISGIADKLGTPESFYAGYGGGVKLPRRRVTVLKERWEEDANDGNGE